MTGACGPYNLGGSATAAAEWNWGKKTVMVPNPWGRGVEESYDFDVTKSDKLFNFLLEKGKIKLSDGHAMLPLIS